jgi:hypothetical protein
MPRRKTPLIMSKTDRQTHLDWQVHEAECVWAVVYDNQTIQIAAEHIQIGRRKYIRTTFPFRGHAEALAERLNKRFDTYLYRAKRLS